MKKIILLLIVFFIILTGCSNDGDKIDEKKDNTNYREMTSGEQEKLLNIIDDLQYFDFLGKSFRVADLNNQDVLQFTYELLGDLLNGKKFAEIETLVSKYLNYSVEPENVICRTHYNVSLSSEDLYLYNSKTDSYSYNSNHLGHGGGGFRTYVVNRYVSSKVTDNTYEIIVYKGFSDLLGDVSTDETEYNFYATYDDAVEQKNPLFKALPSDASAKLEEYDKTDNLVEYKYTFKLKNENYLLTDYEIKKEA